MKESIKALEIITSMPFNLLFDNNTILSCFFFFFLIIDLHCLITAIIAHIFILTAELAIPSGIPAKKKEAKVEMETHQSTVEAKMSKCSI